VVVALHGQKRAIATIALVNRPKVDQYGVVILDDDERIIDFQEKPAEGTERSHLVNTGVYCFSRQIFDYVPADRFYDFGKQVFPQLQAESAAFYGYDAKGAYWCDIGTPEEYRRATVDVLRGVVRIPETRPTGIDLTAQVDPLAKISGEVWIGKRVKIGRAARIVGPSVISDDAIIEEGATIDRSILWEGVRVRAGRVVQGSIVGRSYVVDKNLEDAVAANEEELNPTT
jgi:mannose-1-phosphate guanylyltransferase